MVQDDYIMVPDNSAINPTSKITVEASIKADVIPKTILEIVFFVNMDGPLAIKDMYCDVGTMES